MSIVSPSSHPPQEKHLGLISVMRELRALVSPAHFKTMLTVDPETRHIMTETAARFAGFVATHISSGLGQHTQSIDATIARKALGKHYEHEELTLDDGKILCLIESETDKFRYTLMRTIDQSLRARAYDSAHLGNLLDLDESEADKLLTIMLGVSEIENRAMSVLMQPCLRRLEHIRDAILHRHSMQKILEHPMTSIEMFDILRSTWVLEPASSGITHPDSPSRHPSP